MLVAKFGMNDVTLAASKCPFGVVDIEVVVGVVCTGLNWPVCNTGIGCCGSSPPVVIVIVLAAAALAATTSLLAA